jgi:crotonobetaine/carnitine-CoA ligase
MTLKVYEQSLNPEEEMVVKKLEKWAEELSDQTFIFYGEENKSLSFKAFNGLVNSIARALKDQGIQKGDRISVFLKNPLVSTMVMFGIWKTGAVFCPINFNYKGKLLSYQINDTAPRIIITERKMIPLINHIKDELHALDVMVYDPEEDDHDYDAEVANVMLDRKFPELAFKSFTKGNRSNLETELNYWDTANIIYTSGTTGPAKGVVQSYRWIHGYTFLLRQFNNHEDVIYNDLPLYHVGGAFALVARAAFVGCKVALWDKFSPNDFWRRIELSGATNAILLDVMIPWLMKAKPTKLDYANTLNKVHMQPLPQYHHEVANRFGFDFVTAGYGQTESGYGFGGLINEGKGTPANLYKGYTREETLKIARNLDVPVQQGEEPLRKGYMGVESPFLEAAILNHRDEPCSPEEVGQIAFRPKFPDFILNEYFKKPKATAKVFQNLWFHTGDAGYQDKNGIYYFVDRMGDVIRSRGENVSSYQVEDTLNQHESVNVCAAFPVLAEEGDENEIVVYIVAEEQLNEKELMAWIKSEMPKFMQPKYVRFIADLPRTPTNKIEKYKLKQAFQHELMEAEQVNQ